MYRYGFIVYVCTMNFFKYVLYILIVVFITACTSNTIYKKPKDLIPKEQMVNLLTDMYLANAAKNIKTKALERDVNFMPLVYEKYGIDSTRFQRSNRYYMSRIDDYEAIHKKVETRLKKMRDTTEASLKIKDSLRKIERKKKLPSKKTIIKEQIAKPIAKDQE